MKKILAFTSILIAALFVGCIDLNNGEMVDEFDMEIYDFSHDGHDYIVFTKGVKTINVIHNPDCNCHLHDIK